MHILITGAGGVLGRNLIEYLIERQDTHLRLTDITELDCQPWQAKSGKAIEFCKGDIRDPNFAQNLVENIDVVVHAAAASPSYSDSEIWQTIVGGTKNLLAAAQNQSIKRFVYISSTSVYGIPKKVPVLETDPLESYDAYNKSKIAAEAMCAEYRDQGMCIPVLRPRTFIGPGRLGSFILLFEWAKEGRHFPMVGKGQNNYQFLDVEDLCQAVYLAIHRPSENVNKVFNIGAADFTTMKSDYQAVLDAAGHGKKIICFPVRPVLFVFRILEKLKLSPLYKRLYEKLNLHYHVSIEQAKNELGYQPKYSNQQSLVRNYHWYLENSTHFAHTEGKGNNVPWKQGIFRLAKIFF